ncbi:MAG: pentapeptide repeat-containing protein [Halobacteria archaeon]
MVDKKVSIVAALIVGLVVGTGIGVVADRQVLSGASVDGTCSQMQNGHGGQMTILDGCNLHGMTAQGMDWTGSHLRGVNGDGVNLKNSVFDNSVIAGIKFNKAVMPDTSFKGTSIRGFQANAANFQNADFGPGSEKYDTPATTFIRMANFNGGAQLQRAKFDEAHIEHSMFHESHLDGAIFDGATIKKTTFKGNSYSSKTSFDNVKWGKNKIRGKSCEGQECQKLIEKEINAQT